MLLRQRDRVLQLKQIAFLLVNKTITSRSSFECMKPTNVCNTVQHLLVVVVELANLWRNLTNLPPLQTILSVKHLPTQTQHITKLWQTTTLFIHGHSKVTFGCSKEPLYCKNAAMQKTVCLSCYFSASSTFLFTLFVVYYLHSWTFCHFSICCALKCNVLHSKYLFSEKPNTILRQPLLLTQQ